MHLETGMSREKRQAKWNFKNPYIKPFFLRHSGKIDSFVDDTGNFQVEKRNFM